MQNAQEIRLSGSGGQGLILGGIILAEAAIKDGLNTVQTQSYGPEARGGASKAEVIICQGDIDYPKVTEPGVMLAMTQEACDKYISTLRKEGLLIIDSTFVERIPETGAKVYSLPITKLAKEEMGKTLVANIIALGAVVGITGVVTREAVTEAVLARVPKGTEELNKKALALGFEHAARAIEKTAVRKVVAG
ncbi:2-oxoacid:acceptor oxidoreductase family protein [Metallumcola ferriviriculae]|uniref:2-oxoacid:acceptor oxidoreductase family protein n=1 Tax=Metallumcola ferriviriculae TaxID=3039180 RepID=A0AAU0UT85_9FIRM|nr:2-oxoacid:acceptor oxidoreductase family protein [Desulfitibacteraceae bacterium MK1]